MSRILIFGSTGLLGTEVARVFSERGWDLYMPGRAMCDFTSQDALLGPFLKKLEDVRCIINCAAYADVDEAEDCAEVGLVIASNITALQLIADAALERDIPVVHVSTDYVFGGTGSALYAEDVRPCPVNTYGWSKMMGECVLRASGCKHTIVRTSWLYGQTRPVFVNKVIDSVLSYQPIWAAADLIRVPTPASYVASCIADLVSAEEFGIFHCMPSGTATPYEVATAIQAMLWKGGQSAPISPQLLRYGSGAHRPVDVRLDCSKLVQELGYEGVPHWRAELEQYVTARAASLRSRDPKI